MNKIEIKNRNFENKPSRLRENGFVPGVICGSNLKSSPVKITMKELKKATKRAGEVYQVSFGKKTIFVKLSNIQKDPVTHSPIHFSLVEMPNDVKNEIDIPISLKGTPVGVDKGGVLVVVKDEVTVNGKPRLIPEQADANVSKMEVGDKLTVDDLNIPRHIDTVDDSSDVVAVCRPPIKEISKSEKELTSMLDLDKKCSNSLTTEVAM